MTALTPGTLARLPKAIERPGYDRATLECGVVHLGIGAFHRAHQAWYLDRLLHQQPGPWGIVGASLKRPDMRDRLGPQDGLYTLVTRGEAGTTFRVIGTVRQVLVAPEDPAALVRRLADPATRVVTLTVTEKGYCLDGTGRLDPRHPEIQADLANPDRPATALGFLAAALRARRAAGQPAPVLLTCDNLRSNGDTLRRALADFAALSDDGLARWIEADVAIPNSMVDRIVPATTDADRAEVAAALGLADAAPVIAEPFSQWVIERTPGLPDLARVGVEMVAKAAPYEHMKLRLLNGSHSAIAYLGQLAGLETVAAAMADAELRRFVTGLMAHEIAPTVTGLPGDQLRAYQAALIERWANPAIQHKTQQIAMDGSQKLPIRWLATLRDRIEEGERIHRLSVCLAGWMRYLGGRDEQGRALVISDPRASELQALADPAQPPAVLVERFLTQSGLFDAQLAGHTGLRAGVTHTLASLAERGVAATLAEIDRGA